MRRLLLVAMMFGCKGASAPDPLDSAAGAAKGAASAEVDAGPGAAASGEGAGAEPSGGASASASPGGGASANASASASAGPGATSSAGGVPTTTPSDSNPTQPGAPAGNVEFVMVSVVGGTSSDAVKGTLEKSKQRFRGCYGRALANDPGTSGVLKLRATIAADGAVEKVEVIGGTLGLSPLVQCSVAAVKGRTIAGAAAPATKATFDVKFSK